MNVVVNRRHNYGTVDMPAVLKSWCIVVRETEWNVKAELAKEIVD